MADDAMDAEFDVVAEWTADVAVTLGPEYYLPAACRGSGSPAGLRWLISQLGIAAADRMLDCGAGVGGPAGFAAQQVGVRPVLTDPEAGACRAARCLFDLPTIRAATELPFGSGVFDVAWCLGVLCTVDRQDELLAELRRVLRPGGRLGLLVFVAECEVSASPEGNNFPSREGLRTLLQHAGLTVMAAVPAADLGAVPAPWQEKMDIVDAELERRHHASPAWSTAVDQSRLIGRLLAENVITAQLLATRNDAR